ncbi:MAG: hypothetical protein HQK75_02240 [Candidatus Magnetomorum sp.]|nr:hypothetical protein [Candidatus Magnetomorum sp.]
MSENRYQVIFLGQILDGFDENDVRKNLTPHFKGRVNHLFENAPLVIKRDVSYEEATIITEKMIQRGVMCKVFLPPESDEFELELESNDSDDLALESDDIALDEIDEFNDEQATFETGPRMICPSCGFEQEESEECKKCRIIIEKYQEKTSSQKERDVLQEYIDQMSQMTLPETEKDKSAMMLTFTTVLICISIFILLGWSFHFFVYQKPWRKVDIESITLTPIKTPDTGQNQERIASQKETIAKLQKALNAKKTSLKKTSSQQSSNQFSLKSIPLQLLKHYQGKYVWVTCENDAVHQGTLYAVYAEQIVLKKPRFNLTIPINRSMIKIVEYDLTDSDYDEDVVEAYQAYKRRTEESLQNVSLHSLNAYVGKNIRVYLTSGQLYEGILAKCDSSKITVENIVYGQLVTFVIRKETIGRVLY